MTIQCLPCVAVDAHWECRNPTDVGCCCPGDVNVLSESGTRALKSGEDMLDVESTGRKRAAEVAPLDVNAACEWQGLKSAGGGVDPIIGCLAGKQTNRHHGPDKSVLNNELSINLHRICAHCHNRWHTKNDLYYGDRPENGTPFLPINKECLPHDGDTKATTEELALNEIYWATSPKNRSANAQFEYDSITDASPKIPGVFDE